MLRLLLCLLFAVPIFGQTTLRQLIVKHAAAAGGRVGVACALPGRDLDCNLNPNAKLPMQSVYKLPIAMATLNSIELGKLTLEQKARFLRSDLISPGQHSPLRDAHPQADTDVAVKELLRLAVSESDGVASDILLRIAGGPAKIDAYISGLGITGIHVQDSEKIIGSDVRAQYRNYAEATALVDLLRRLADRSPLLREHTELLLRWMTVTRTGEHRLRALLPPGTVVAHKTGTSGSDGGITNATNDIGLITLPDGRRLAIAVLVCDSPRSERVREGVIAQIAYDVWQAASGQNKRATGAKADGGSELRR